MRMIKNILFKGSRAARKGRPRFGKHMFVGAHRYVYYIDKRPYYYFSDRPYTVEDATSWKRRGLFFSLVITIILLSVLLEGDSTVLGPAMVPFYILGTCLTIYNVLRFIAFLTIHPEEDPMLQSFQCTEDFKKPPEITCKYCGGIFSHGAHTVCPHCKATIEDD